MHASVKKIRQEKKKIDSLASRRVNPRGLSRPRRSAPAGSVADLNIVSDPIEAAEEAGLRYVSDGQPGNKVLATVVQLLERTFIRVGNEAYARENKSFGLTTMQDRHVDVKGSQLRFRFRGKRGIKHQIDLTDRRIAKIVSKFQDLPGQELFQYVDDDGEVRDITSQDVNDYLREVTGHDFTAKDFRTWAGTVLAAMALSVLDPFETKKQARANIKDAIRVVSKLLGNTPVICRKCYVHPAILEAYLDGNSIEGLKQKAEEAVTQNRYDLRSSETAVLNFLQACLARKAS